MLIRYTSALLLAVYSTLNTVAADELRIAVAANFADTLTEISDDFTAATGHTVVMSRASTGVLYAQILNGAPFDVFLAADSLRPELLVQQDVGVPDSRATYAIGRLVLWTPAAGRDGTLADVLGEADFRHLAIANPQHAPYGKAAAETLVALGVWEELQEKLVRGENINQAFAFVATGNAEFGLVANSQVVRKIVHSARNVWAVPAELHSPLEQQLIVLSDSAAASEFADYLLSTDARRIISADGYDLPEF